MLAGATVGLGAISKAPCNDVKLDIGGNPTCITEQAYKGLKTALLEEFNDKSKGYDFDINSLPTLNAVLSREAEGMDLRFNGTLTKDAIKVKLLDLLSN